MGTDEGECKECGHPGGGHNMGCPIHHRIALDEIERLRAENEKLGAALEIARCHVVASNEAEGMMDGFGPRRPRPSDVDLAIIDEALGNLEQTSRVDEDDGDHRFSKDSYF